MLFLTVAELIAATLTGWLALVIVLAYGLDAVGVPIAPFALGVAAATIATLVALRHRRRAAWQGPELVAWAGVVLLTLAWLLWLAWPGLLPPGRGPDLAHHLLLIDYIERHWQLVHDLRLEPAMGEMAFYTPGAHLLSAVAGAWTRSDGLHAVYPLVAVATAIAVGFAFLVTRRMLRTGASSVAAALVSALWLLFAHGYVADAFTHDSFMTQALSALFAVAMWWAAVAWDEDPGWSLSAFVGLTGAAVFLTWPIWLGPPLLVFSGLVLWRRTLSWRARAHHLLIGLGPIVVFAVLHAVGRTAWILLIRSSGAVPPQSPTIFGWVLPVLALAGAGLTIADGRGRATLWLVVACAAQAAVLAAMAFSYGTKTPYMALKMAYLAVYPMAVFGARAIASALDGLTRLLARVPLARALGPGVVAWLGLGGLAALVVPPLLALPRPVPILTADLSRAGSWARSNVDPACVDYLVADPYTAYWLHLAVLGNPRTSARTAEVDLHDARAAIGRWIVPNGLPYAVADLGMLPDEVRATSDLVARFGTAGVIKRRGASVCAP